MFQRLHTHLMHPDPACSRDSTHTSCTLTQHVPETPHTPQVEIWRRLSSCQCYSSATNTGCECPEAILSVAAEVISCLQRPINSILAVLRMYNTSLLPYRAVCRRQSWVQSHLQRVAVACTRDQGYPFLDDCGIHNRYIRSLLKHCSGRGSDMVILRCCCLQKPVEHPLRCLAQSSCV